MTNAPSFGEVAYRACLMRGFCPRAILFNRANTILLQVAAPADLALCDRFEAGHVWALSRAGLIASFIE